MRGSPKVGEREESKGFAGLSDLLSDIDIDQENQKSEDRPNVSTKSKASFPALDLQALPSAPAPWLSESPGESWQWGGFCLTFQKEPRTVLDQTLTDSAGEITSSLISYRYASCVFNQPRSGSVESNESPIFISTLEQAGGNVSGDSDWPLILGAFVPGAHLNYGEYSGPIDNDSVRQALFEIIAQHFELSGMPKKIGSLADANPSLATTSTSGTKKPSKPGKKGNAKAPSGQSLHPATSRSGSKGTGNSGANSGSRTAFGWVSIIFIGLVTFAIVLDEQKRASYSAYDRPSQSDFSAPNQDQVNASETRDFALRFDKPAFGENNTLTDSEIAWCLREDIKLEAMRTEISSDPGTQTFNALISDYNSRCASYRYYEDAMRRATRYVNSDRQKFVEDAVNEAREIERRAKNTMYMQPTQRGDISTANSSSQHSESEYQAALNQFLRAGYDYQRASFEANAELARRRGESPPSWNRSRALNTPSSDKCVYKAVMTDDDYRRCGAEPPKWD